jgi:predicted aspartyl protease
MGMKFDPTEGLVHVMADVFGPRDGAVVALGVDTGATSTILSAAVLQFLGYDPGAAEERVRVTTGSGVEFVPRVQVQRMVALDQQRVDFAVLSHTLPPSTGVDGVLGLDFMRGMCLTIDFRAGLARLD